MSHPKRTNSFQPWQQCPGTIPLDYLAAVELANIHSRTERKNVLAGKKSSAWDVFLSPNIVMTYHHRFPHVGYEASVRLERTETQGAKTGRKEQSGVFFINIPPTTQPAKKICGQFQRQRFKEPREHAAQTACPRTYWNVGCRTRTCEAVP